MSILTDMLKEERNRLLDLKREYIRLIQALPKGSISQKRRGNVVYAYLAYRDENGKIKFSYQGKNEDKAVIEMEKEIAKRRNYQKLLRMTKKNLKEVERAIGGKKL